MAFDDTAIFPDSIARNVSRTRRTKTQQVERASGHLQVNRVWAGKLRQWDVGLPTRNESDYAAIRHWFEAMDGPYMGFLFRDPDDDTTVTSSGQERPQGLLQPTALGANVGAAGLGYGVPFYQIVARYTRGATSSDRVILKPRTSLSTVYRAASPVTVGVGAGNIAFSATLGTVTFVADASSAASSITVGATTQVVLTTNPGTLIAGQRLYLSGFTGADAASVNGSSHLINSVSGSGPYTFTLATVTTGETITLGSGLGAKYPQASESLTWAGRFYVPAGFVQDEIADTIMQSIGGGQLILQAQSVLIRERRSGT
jgi:uncharacterized protein (TIGR02217 family)